MIIQSVGAIILFSSLCNNITDGNKKHSLTHTNHTGYRDFLFWNSKTVDVFQPVIDGRERLKTTSHHCF